LHSLIRENFKFDAVIGEDGPFKADYVTSCMAACANLGITYRDVTGEPYMATEPLSVACSGQAPDRSVVEGQPGLCAGCRSFHVFA
jgi:short subunit dehydrogenase-like uncharacterized protein